MPQTPYSLVPSKGFWKQAVADTSLFDIDLEWEPKFRFGQNTRISTFGSCFAQHFGHALKKRNMRWLDAEPINAAVSDAVCQDYGYRVFSARTANIYTTSLLRQWTEWSLGLADVPGETWTNGDRFFDPFRPRIEPNGFESLDELLRLRQQTLSAFRLCIEKSDVFVFTLGLTESWFHTSGYEYPMCPGTAAGTFDPDNHIFRNQDFTEVREALTRAILHMRKANPRLKFLLTVSPVPLTATMSGDHVVTATMHSKSILRAVAGELAGKFAFVDYFPSYEIINSPAFRSVFFNPNLRTVNQRGVDFVMETFFRALKRKFGFDPSPQTVYVATPDDIKCEEALLETFGDAQ